MLPVQLFEAPQRYAPVNGEYPVRNRPYINKPQGQTALWTSTWAGEQYGSERIQWCLANQFRGNPFDCYLLTPDPTARIYTIDTLGHLVDLQAQYPFIPDDMLEDERAGKRKIDPFWRTVLIDFVAVASDYDAIHLTDQGQCKTAFSLPCSLYAWDCESTCWFRGNFTIESLGLRDFKTGQFYDE